MVSLCRVVTWLVLTASNAGALSRTVTITIPAGTAANYAAAHSALGQLELLWPSSFQVPQTIPNVPVLQSVAEYNTLFLTFFELPACERCCTTSCGLQWPSDYRCVHSPTVDDKICLPPEVVLPDLCVRQPTHWTCPRGTAIASLWAGGTAVWLATLLYRKVAEAPPKRAKSLILKK